MFDFWKEVIINSEEKLTNALRPYDANNIVDKKVYKTEPVDGSGAVITVAAGISSTPTRVRVELGLSAGQSSEFAAPYFASKKTVVVDAESTEGLVKALGAALEGLVSVNKTNRTITFNDPKVCVTSVHKATFDSTAGDWGTDSKVEWVTPNVLPVGTGAWILENLRYPTSVNSSYVGPNADETVDPEAKYVQYAFEYAVPKRGFHGQGAVGQEVTSVTHHIFYVKNDVAVTGTILDGENVKDFNDPTDPHIVYSYVKGELGTTNSTGTWNNSLE